MQYTISLAVSIIPLLSITFVTVLLLYKLYVKIRSNFKVTVNCWFCNQNTKVPYLETNSFTCPQCEQYNGFNKDGDYNREIYQQLDCSNLSSSRRDEQQQQDLSDFSDQFPSNGFCQTCNEGQRLKVEKLAQFEPKNESKFEEELKAYKNQLEEQYRLCSTCDRHLKTVLREKKKMVLGSKFLDYIIKGAEQFKQPHFARLKSAQKSKLKRRISIYLAIVAFINVCCLLKQLPDLTKDNVTSILGDKIGRYTFLMISHVLALIKVFASYSEVLSNHHTVQKLSLFFKTIAMMVMYSMGMKLPQMAALSMSSMLVLVSPFLMLGLGFIYNLVDGFKLSRFTFMLTLWSLCAGGLLDYEQVTPAKDVILVGTAIGLGLVKWQMFLYFQLSASVLTIYLAMSTKSASNVIANDDTSSSFHKIYSEDCLSDEDTRETISLISQKLNSSGNSVMSGCSNRSFMSPSHLSSLGKLSRSPITSSVFSLNGAQRSPPFRSFCREEESLANKRNYAASMSNFPTNRSMFASNMELNCNRPPSAYGANASFNAPLVMNASMTGSNKQSNDSFHKANHASMHYANAPLASPFSVSSNAVYQRSNLLTPSRFSTNSLTTNNPAASWLSGGYFNSAHAVGVPQSPVEKRNFFLEHRNGMNSIHENMSRASSQSSGFESQSSANLRDNSACPDQEHYPHIVSSVSDCQSGFYPIENNVGQFQRPSSILSTSSFLPPMASPLGSLSGFSSVGSQLNLNSIQPLSVNCNQDYWKPPMKAQPPNGMSNAFNLRKINEELPPIQRGALLKKWKEGQAVS